MQFNFCSVLISFIPLIYLSAMDVLNIEVSQAERADLI